MKIKMYSVEEFKTIIFRESLEIETDNYPELNGMTEEEIKQYIKENATEMAPTFKGIYESLAEECWDCNVVNEKVPSSDTEILFDEE
jgi:hypothetical protein